MQLAFGGLDLSPRQITAAAINIASPLSYLLFGRGRRGVKMGCLLGETGTALTLWPDLAAGNFHVWAGFGLFTFAQLCGFFSSECTARFEKSRYSLLRHSLGTPRRWLGGITALSRLSVIVHGISHAHWNVAIPFLLWLLGDGCVMFSRAETSHLRRLAATP